MSFRQPFRGDYPITQRYGEVIPGVTYQGKPHTGIDYGCPAGTPVLASGDGVVMFAGESTTGYGRYVILQHEGRIATLYAHLNSISVRLNQQIRQGDLIGYSGATGYATGPHLHFEARTRWNDYTSHFDPMTLPLMSFADPATEKAQVPEETSQLPEETSQLLKGPMQLGEAVMIVAPAGAWAWSPDFSKRQTVYPCGTQLHFTGRTAERLGYVYCEVYPEPVPYWVAVHDGETQILDNA